MSNAKHVLGRGRRAARGYTLIELLIVCGLAVPIALTLNYAGLPLWATTLLGTAGGILLFLAWLWLRFWLHRRRHRS
jgi:hypothetical protein